MFGNSEMNGNYVSKRKPIKIPYLDIWNESDKYMFKSS